ncbi:hypothetical protein CVS40_11078 [Lucilia cuprina]|nr:hypothetical protein CVS40_11078 [Lucilia cuprina]
MYETLKQQLQERFSDSKEEQLKKLLRNIELGDIKHSTLLREMSILSSGKVSDELLKNLWMQRLSKQMHAILSISGESFNRLALMANKIAETLESWEVNAIAFSSTLSNCTIEKNTY